MKKYLAKRVMKNITSRSNGKYSFKYNEHLDCVIQDKPRFDCYEAWSFILNNLKNII